MFTEISLRICCSRSQLAVHNKLDYTPRHIRYYSEVAVQERTDKDAVSEFLPSSTFWKCHPKSVTVSPSAAESQIRCAPIHTPQGCGAWIDRPHGRIRPRPLVKEL